MAPQAVAPDVTLPPLLHLGHFIRQLAVLSHWRVQKRHPKSLVTRRENQSPLAVTHHNGPAGRRVLSIGSMPVWGGPVALNPNRLPGATRGLGGTSALTRYLLPIGRLAAATPRRDPVLQGSATPDSRTGRLLPRHLPCVAPTTSSQSSSKFNKPAHRVSSLVALRERGVSVELPPPLIILTPNLAFGVFLQRHLPVGVRNPIPKEFPLKPHRFVQ